MMEASPWLRLAADVIFEAAIRVASLGAQSNQPLTRREKECLAWASEGKTTAEIAAILGITPRTVTYYIQQVLGKTHSTNRDQAIAKATAGCQLLPSLNVDVDNVY
ncbi:Transcriptional activator protein LuxR [compost metagenome]